MRYYWYIASIPAINTVRGFRPERPLFRQASLVLKFGYRQIRHCDASCSAKSRGWVDDNIWVQSRMARKSNCLCPKIRVPSNYPFWFFVYRNPSAACFQQMQCICRQSVHMLRWFGQRSRLSRCPEVPISGKISRSRNTNFRENFAVQNHQFSGKFRDSGKIQKYQFSGKFTILGNS